MATAPLVRVVVPLESRSSGSLIVLVLLVTLFAGCLDGTDTPQARPDATGGQTTHPLVPLYDALRAAPEVRFETDHGTIRLLLYTELMPRTAARFAELVEDGFYDDTLVHRVVDDFVIQGGDPSGTGQAGSGETIAFERDPDLLFASGAMGLARDLDPDSGDSQWFLTERPAPHLSDPDSDTAAVFGTYALYGQVFAGMDVVRKIAAVPVIPGADRPIEDVILQEARLLAPPEDIDLLHYPPTLDGPFTIGGDTLTIERPLHLFEGHAFPLTVVVAPDDERKAPAGLLAEHRPTQATTDGPDVVRTRLTPLPDDPWVFTGDITLPDDGAWSQAVSLQGTLTEPHEVAVRTLDPVLGAYRVPGDDPKDG